MKRILGVVLALILALSLVSMGTVLASDRLVDQKAKVDFHATMMGSGASGTAEVELRIDADGMLELAKAKATAEGLMAGVTYSYWVGGVFVGSAVADDNGGISIDEELSDFGGYTTLLGLKVKIIEGFHGDVVLKAKIMELEKDVIAEVDEEE